MLRIGSSISLFFWWLSDGQRLSLLLLKIGQCIIIILLQGRVVTYLRCGGVVSNQIKKSLLLVLSVNYVFFNWWIFGKVTSKNVQVVSCCLSAWPPHWWNSKRVKFPCFQFCKAVQIHWTDEVGNYSVCQLPTFYETFPPKIVNIQLRIVELQVKCRGCFSCHTA